MPNENDSVNYAVLTFQLDMRRKLVFSRYAWKYIAKKRMKIIDNKLDQRFFT